MMEDGDLEECERILEGVLADEEEEEEESSELMSDALVQLARTRWSLDHRPHRALPLLHKASLLDADEKGRRAVALLRCAALFESGRREEALEAAEGCGVGEMREWAERNDAPLLCYATACRRFVYVWLVLPGTGLAHSACHVLDAPLRDEMRRLHVSIGIDVGDDDEKATSPYDEEDYDAADDRLLATWRGELVCEREEVRSEEHKSPVHLMHRLLIGPRIDSILSRARQRHRAVGVVTGGGDGELALFPFALLKRDRSDEMLASRFRILRAASFARLARRSSGSGFDPRLACCSLVRPPCLDRRLARHFGGSSPSSEEWIEGVDAIRGATREGLESELARSGYVRLSSHVTAQGGVLVCDGRHAPLHPAPTPTTVCGDDGDDDDDEEFPTSDERVGEEWVVSARQLARVDMRACRLVCVSSPHSEEASRRHHTAAMRRLARALERAGAGACLVSAWPLPESPYRLVPAFLL